MQTHVSARQFISDSAARNETLHTHNVVNLYGTHFKMTTKITINLFLNRKICFCVFSVSLLNDNDDEGDDDDDETATVDRFDQRVSFIRRSVLSRRRNRPKFSFLIHFVCAGRVSSIYVSSYLSHHSFAAFCFH